MTPMRIATRLACLVCLSMAMVLTAYAEDMQLDEARYVADIELQTTAEFGDLLRRASQLLAEGLATQDGLATITFVLHGPVVRDLLRQNYLANREVVDLAASLSALQVVKIKACQTWMGSNGVNEADLQPFVETVSFAPGEVQRLLVEKNYIRF
jgi:intracellular sulfur oxidation DsrE/DsrF family protein